MSEEFYSVVTDYGIQKQLSCLKNTEEFDLSQIVLGDGSGNYYEPDTSQTELVNEVWRGEITKCVWENGKFYCLTSVPADEGGFYIREAGVLDSAGNLIVVSKFPETYKQTPDSGSVKQLIIKIEINFLNSSVSSLAVNANISYATQTEVETINSSKANIDLDNLSEAGEARFDSKLDCSIAVTYTTLGYVSIKLEDISTTFYDVIEDDGSLSTANETLSGTVYEVID
ncbi:MAG: phage tail protein [Candidatus Gastranaerophilales bacterium]|nr:phage tail protein [Candidatus Gastranaerophilales bacterium]